LRRMIPFRNFKCSKHWKFAVPSWKHYFENENELSKICFSYQNLGGNQLTNFLTDSVLIILQDLMNFRLTGYAKLYSWS
jgi:hypothetical protein